ncbi:aminodeoxychorismate synthase component I [Chitinophaga sp. SYP-B3965]|uniref:anthranilate synthase component I family protein n=1 Tax=Chitinophaga sp. SYP-B3965 TaxID=2663120 RepID=UPI00129969FC|nr:anthranilate synthase component I family protein [Chitinophaga sp. SYP-B3965]MRG47833.1 aminodeoxychorismate synthase component I [Chitinophaga sp. SYP-B3965]
MLSWGNRFNICCFLDNNDYRLRGQRAEALLAADAVEQLQCNAGTAFEQLHQFHAAKPGWLFGHLGYDLKNETEKLSSSHPDGIQFPDLFFFRPRYLLLLQQEQVLISGEDLTETAARKIYEACLAEDENPSREVTWAPFSLDARMDETYYLAAVRALQEHIRKGDCYEVNFCREQFAHTDIDPLVLFRRLNVLSPSPFAAYYRTGDKYLVCSSPERFLQKEGSTLISQPIKGTITRAADPARDAVLRQELLNSAKERAENVMIVDLVRNDLSKTAVQGTVSVDELFGIYAFPQVHHMISTVKATLDDHFHFTDAIRAAFPMGSMTGAPKLRVMELIEQYEQTKRGLFSGAVGYITPEGDLDLNVVIRSILYNAENNYLSFQTGSAITFNSTPEKEWEECLLKAKALKTALGF